MSALDLAARTFVGARALYRRARTSTLATVLRMRLARLETAQWRWLTEPLTPGEKCCLFVSYSPDGQLPQRAVDHARIWQQGGYEVLFIIALDDFAVQPQVPFGHAIARENTGFDFAAWASPIGELDWSATRFLATVNDSVYASTRLAEEIARAEKHPADMVGFTDSHDYRWHLQSYAWHFKRAAIAHPAFAQFWARPTGDRAHAIFVFETQLAQLLRGHGLQVAALYPTAARLDPTFDDWLDLARKGLPYVKRRALALHYDAWAPHLAELGFDAKLIERDRPAPETGAKPGLLRQAARRAMR